MISPDIKKATFMMITLVLFPCLAVHAQWQCPSVCLFVNQRMNMVNFSVSGHASPYLVAQWPAAGHFLWP